LMRFIHRVQLQQLKQLREQSLHQADAALETGTEPIFSRRRVKKIRPVAQTHYSQPKAGMTLFPERSN